MRLFRTFNALLLGAGLIAAAPLVQAQTAANTKSVAAVAPGKAMAGASATATATVTAVDTATRVVTLKGADGKVFDITCGDEVKNFAQIKVGDLVHAEYTMGLSLELKKAGSKGTEKKGAAPVEEHGVAAAPVGSKPAAAVTRKVTALADVIAVDEKNHVVSLRGPRGNEVDLDVEDPAQLKNIKKGDHVEVVYTEALAVVVETAPKPTK